jgi:transposase-like protein
VPEDRRPDREVDLGEWAVFRSMVPVGEEVAAAARRGGWAPASLLRDAITDWWEFGRTLGEAGEAALEAPTQTEELELDYRLVGMLERCLERETGVQTGLTRTAFVIAVARDFLRRNGIEEER